MIGYAEAGRGRKSPMTSLTCRLLCNVEDLNFGIQNLRSSNVKVTFQRPSCGSPIAVASGFIAGTAPVHRTQNFTPSEISPQRLTLQTSNFVHGTAIRSLSLVMSECSLSGRGQGHMSNFYIVDLDNFATASRRYTGDIHN